MFIALLCFAILAPGRTESFCGDRMRWSHHISIERAYGVWYAVGYAQHTPDMTNKPIEVGCVTLYVSDATGDYEYDWLDWSMRQRYNDTDWESLRSNARSGDEMSGSWPNVRFRRKRNLFQERRIRILWDEDGETMEQIYDYSPQDPGLWTAERWRPGEREMKAKGVDMWYPDDPPRHPEVVRVLKLTPDEMIMNHCTELGDGGIFSLVLRRAPARLAHRERLEWRRLLLSYGLTNPYRYLAVCNACTPFTSLLCFIASMIASRLL